MPATQHNHQCTCLHTQDSLTYLQYKYHWTFSLAGGLLCNGSWALAELFQLTPFLFPKTRGCCQERNRAGPLSAGTAISAQKIEAVAALFCHQIPPKTPLCISNPWANFLATNWRTELIVAVCTKQHLPVNSWLYTAKLGATACCLQ